MVRETVAIHGGFVCDPATRAVSPPIYQNVAYEFDSADHAAALFDLEKPGFRYSRIANPTVDILEQRVAALEGGVGALCVASGQAALHYALLTLADRGGSIVAPPQLYGTSHTLLAHTLRGHGIEARFAASDRRATSPPAWTPRRGLFSAKASAIPPATSATSGLRRYSPSNGLPLIVDNTVATPILLRPFEHGADVVVHSLTKFMGGHGAAMGGAIVDSGGFDWSAQARRFPMFCEPDSPTMDSSMSTDSGATPILRARGVSISARPGVLAPMSAFLLLQGIETVALRVERHVANAFAVAEFLRRDPRIASVDYAGFPDNRYHALAQKYLGGRPPALLTFLVGGLEAAKAFYDALKLIKRLVNIGDTRTLAAIRPPPRIGR